NELLDQSKIEVISRGAGQSISSGISPVERCRDHECRCIEPAIDGSLFQLGIDTRDDIGSSPKSCIGRRPGTGHGEGKAALKHSYAGKVPRPNQMAHPPAISQKTLARDE